MTNVFSWRSSSLHDFGWNAGFPVLTSLKPVHRCGNEVVRLTEAGLSEALVFCRCQFVINTKWHDQRHAFETKKAIIGSHYSKGFIRSMRSCRCGWVTHHHNRETIHQACQYCKKDTYMYFWFAPCTWGKKLGGLKLLDCLTVWFKTKGPRVC